MPTHPTDSAKKISSSHLNLQVGLYALAAATAGVTMLALAEPATGEVVVTKKTIHIPISIDGIQKRVPISVANNGVDNFSFVLSSTAGVRRTFVGFSAGSTGSDNQIIAGGNFYGKALPLPRGTKISANPTSGVFSWMPLIEATDTSAGSFYSRGYWKGNQKNQYLGVRFKIDGQFHYGWIRLTVTSDVKLEKPTLEASITGYAYETVPNKPILAGTVGTASAIEEKKAPEVQSPKNIQTSNGPSLGMLASGSEALPLWRREETPNILTVDMR